MVLHWPELTVCGLSRAPESCVTVRSLPIRANSGSIERFFIFREEVYKQDDPDLQGQSGIIIAKELAFLKEFDCFDPCSRFALAPPE